MKLRVTSRDIEKRYREDDERLKQRIAALGARIRRYDGVSKRRQQEKAFAVNQSPNGR